MSICPVYILLEKDVIIDKTKIILDVSEFCHFFLKIKK